MAGAVAAAGGADTGGPGASAADSAKGAAGGQPHSAHPDGPARAIDWWLVVSLFVAAYVSDCARGMTASVRVAAVVHFEAVVLTRDAMRVVVVVGRVVHSHAFG